MLPVIVLDTNVCVAALLKSASCRAVLTLWRHGRLTVAMSEPLLRELRDVLARPKFHVRITEADRREFLAFAEATSLRVQPMGLRHPICRDRSDDKLFACAFAAGASGIVSGDADVLSAGPIGGLRLFSPASFLAWLSHRSSH